MKRLETVDWLQRVARGATVACVVLILSLVSTVQSAPLPAMVPCAQVFAETEAAGFTEVSFPSGGIRIGALLEKPSGAGPLPAYVHTHGGIRQQVAHGPLAAVPSLDPAVVRAGYVVLLIARRGHFGSGGSVSAYQGGPAHVGVSQFVQLLYQEATDVMAAVTFLSGCPFVDPKRIAIGGHSTGGFISVVAAARLPELAAVASINGGISWFEGGRQVGHDATMNMFTLEGPKIKAPVLVLVGARDLQIPSYVGLHLAQVRRERGLPVELRLYQGDHSPWPERELIGFLDRHLQPPRR